MGVLLIPQGKRRVLGQLLECNNVDTRKRIFHSLVGKIGRSRTEVNFTGYLH